MSVQDLSLPDLCAVAAVAAHGHFGRAAAALHLAQPTLSARVSKVESALGVRLFERSARRFLVTPEGERVLPMVRELLAAADRLGSATDEHETARELRLGVIPTLGPYLMPHLLFPWSRRRGGPALAITEQPTARLVELLLDGTLDAALLSLPLRNDSLDVLPLFDEPFRLIAPRDSEIARMERLSASKMCARDMILLEEGHCLREQAIAVCGKRGGSSPRVVTTSLETLKYLVASGAGYSLLPLLACELPRGLEKLVVLREFDERPPSRRIALCVRRSLARREEAERLARFVRENPPEGVGRAR